jgi:hypothetical protein
LLIKLTRERREPFCANTNIDILTEDELQIVLNDWKTNYKQWMHPETLRRSYSLTQQGWHQMLRKSFRSFLFHLVGCYEMTLFFLVAPFTPDTLDLFRISWEQSTTNEGSLTLSKRLARGPWPVLDSLADETKDPISPKPQWSGKSRRY